MSSIVEGEVLAKGRSKKGDVVSKRELDSTNIKADLLRRVRVRRQNRAGAISRSRFDEIHLRKALETRRGRGYLQPESRIVWHCRCRHRHQVKNRRY
jgi:hypothetical protein